jgi:lactate permease
MEPAAALPREFSMLLAYQQNLNPLNSAFLSTVMAALPVVTLFVLLVPLRWLAPKAALGGAVVALLVAVFAYQMPADMALLSLLHGALFGLLPVGWTIFNAMLLYNITVETGQFAIVRRSVAGLSGDARIQAILIGFAFGAFLEGAAGGGTPVAICGAIMVGLGFDPFLAAVLCLIANTSPVAYGGLGTPLITLNGVTDLPTATLSVMAGHQLPIMSFIIPLWMVKCMCTWKQTWEVWPALLAAGGSFAAFQFTFATFHVYGGLELWPMTDIGGGIFSLLVTAILLRYWRPKKEWHFNRLQIEDSTLPIESTPSSAVKSEISSLKSEIDLPLTARRIAVGWMPFALMSIALFALGLLRQVEGERQRLKQEMPRIGPIQTTYPIPIAGLHEKVYRDPKLLAPGKSASSEKAEFHLVWLTGPGTPVFLAAVASMFLLRMNRRQIAAVIRRTIFQMRIPVPTIALMLGLSYVTRYAGMDATLGVAFAGTGLLYPFFAAILGWLGVFLTGTDAGSNALFGSLQKITATEVYNQHGHLFAGLDQSQVQVLICTANSTGGVMGKMIDAQSICVATAATHQIGKEADIFKAVLWHSIVLAALMGGIVLLQAYVWPFSLLVPGVR